MTEDAKEVKRIDEREGAMPNANVKNWADDKDSDTIVTTINTVHKHTCSTGVGDTRNGKYLCAQNFVETATQLLIMRGLVNVVQIGAHVGFEKNGDPLTILLLGTLDEVSSITNATELRHLFHWTFVEPSPPNFKGLEANIKKMPIHVT